MRLEDIHWRNNENSGFKSARFDNLIPKYDNKGNQYRAGKSVNIAYWEDGRPNPYMFSGRGISMSLAGFKVWLCNKCQVAYNEWGEF